MKLISKDGEVLAGIALEARKGEPVNACIDVVGKTFQAPLTELSIGKEEDGLGVHVRIPGVVNCTLCLEAGDVAALKTLMNKDAIGFMVKALLKG